MLRRLFLFVALNLYEIIKASNQCMIKCKQQQQFLCIEDHMSSIELVRNSVTFSVVKNHNLRSRNFGMWWKKISVFVTWILKRIWATKCIWTVRLRICKPMLSQFIYLSSTQLASIRFTEIFVLVSQIPRLNSFQYWCVSENSISQQSQSRSFNAHRHRIFSTFPFLLGTCGRFQVRKSW